MSKLITLSESTTQADTDLIYIVKDPSTAPVDRKMSVANLLLNTVKKASDDTITGIKTFLTNTLLSPDITTTDDFTVKTGSNKTMVLNQPVYNDINIGGGSLGSGASAPAIISLDTTTIPIYAFSGTNSTPDYVFGSFELAHDYKEGTDIFPHVHWLPTTTNVGNAKWFLEYYIRNDNVVKLSGILSVVSASNGVAWEEIRANFGTITGATLTIGTQIFFKLYRDATDAQDTYAFNAGLSTVGLHYQCDTLGSRQTGTK